MAVTVPGFYKFTRFGSGIFFPKDVLASDLERLRANSHEVYSAVGLRRVVSHYFPNELVTSSTSAVTVLEIPFRLATDRDFTDSVVVTFRRTGTCTVAVILRNAADSSTIDSSTSANVAGVYTRELDPNGNTDLLLRVQVHVSSGTEGIDFIQVSESAIAAGDLP